MIINIVSDASSYQQDAGFAYWVSSYQFEFQQAGYVSNLKIGVAELYAINHALENLLAREIIPISKINIYTDSTEAIHKIKKCVGTEALFNMIELTIKNGMRARQVFELFDVRHVKAHTKGKSDLQHKNRWADLMAKQHRCSKTAFQAVIFDNSDILL